MNSSSKCYIDGKTFNCLEEMLVYIEERNEQRVTREDMIKIFSHLALELYWNFEIYNTIPKYKEVASIMDDMLVHSISHFPPFNSDLSCPSRA